MTPNEICKAASSGNTDAERFCLSWVQFCHTLDDCYDRDHVLDDSTLASVFTAFILELSGNAWFLAHKAMLLGLMVQASNYWLQSNTRKGAERDILKGYWHSVIYQAAFITGGWKHMLHVTRETLEFDYEAEDKQ